MKSFQKINKKEVEEYLNKALFKTFFHSLEWQNFLEKEFKWLKFEHYLYRDDFLITFSRVKSCPSTGRDKLISLPFCEYGGPLPLKKGIDFEPLKEFKNFKIKFHPAVKIGRSDSSINTHWIELKNKSEQDLLNSFRKTLRHSIRDAQKNNLEIKKCSNKKELKTFYNLYAINLKRKKTVPYPFSVIEFLYNNSNSELLIAVYKGRIIAGDLFLHYGKFVHYFLSASDYKYKRLGANYLLLWKKIKSLIGKDIIFDFGAAPQGSKLEVFKRGWGGTEKPIYQIGIKRTEENLRSSKLRNVYGLLPVSIIKKLSPYLIKYRL